MRKITNLAVSCFMNNEVFKSGNTEVKVLSNVTILILFNNEIAYKYNDPKQTISITTSGWKSNTTKERLNAIPGVNIYQKNFEWFLNGIEWDGRLIDIK